MRTRKPKKVMWLVIWNGSGSSNVTVDMQAAWNTKRAALRAISNHPAAYGYTVEKYVRGA